MTTFFETGHSKNVANLLKYEQFLATLGVGYNPANTNITASAISTLYNNADTKVNAEKTAFTTWKQATNQREINFKELKSLSTKLLGALQSTGTAQQTINDFAFYVKKLRGNTVTKSTKADAGITDPPPTDDITPTPTPTEPTTISTSQQSYDNKMQHFSKMILLLQGQPVYVPNETEFQVASLQTRFTTITTINDTANTAIATLRAARIERNTFMYAENTGVLDLIKQSKAYIKSVYGADSQQYKTANSIKFVRVISTKKAK